MKLSCFIINLRDSPQNFEKQRPLLLEEGLDPIRFIGVDARKDEHLEHLEHVTDWCRTTCPKTAIGCGLSHVLLARHIRDLGLPMALVLEDDAYPKTGNLLQHIQKTIQETPDDWDILKLHCFFPCRKNSITSKGSSTAAYLVSSRGIQKLADTKVNTHLDFQINTSEFKVYKSRNNLFWTDESMSTNRGSNSTFGDLQKFGFEGEHSLSQCISYKILRVPGTKLEITGVHCIVLLILFLFMWRM
jgi:GR25 family glycosyltransferase involved in LPS biosynthesis